jgi:hypothetical protein
VVDFTATDAIGKDLFQHLSVNCKSGSFPFVTSESTDKYVDCVGRQTFTLIGCISSAGVPHLVITFRFTFLPILARKMADQVTDSMQALDLTTKASASPVVDGAPEADDFVDPWNVVSTSEKGIDYDKLISK